MRKNENKDMEKGRWITDFLESKFQQKEDNDEDIFLEEKELSKKPKGFSNKTTAIINTIDPTEIYVNNNSIKTKRNKNNLKLRRSTRPEMAKRLSKIEQVISNNHSIKTITKIFNLSLNDPNRKFEKIYKLLHDKELLLLACANISNNYGSSTPGTTPETIDGISLQRIEEISEELKNKNYKFSPFRRILIDKPPKPGEKKNAPKKKRPLGIPEWKDRIVQEALRLVLNAIYEPVFYQEGRNYGFRPKLSCQHAITYIKNYCIGLPTVIEGDIKGAYDNVNFEIFLNILKQKIDDPHLLKLIENSLHCGLIFKDHYQDTLLGVPQGSIVSPLFFNIYMHEFDKFVLNELAQNINLKPKRNSKYRKKYPEKRNRYLTTETHDTLSELGKYTRYFKKQQKENPNSEALTHKKRTLYRSNKTYIEKLKQYRIIKKHGRKIKYTDPQKNEKRIEYVRYADDWVLFTNMNYKDTTKLKEKCNSFLQEKLKLKLSEDKTKITNLNKHEAKFLGFNLSMYSTRYTTVKEYKKTTKQETMLKKQYKKKTTSGLIRVGIDQDRIINRMILNKFITNKSFPRSNPSLTTLSMYDIIQYFNSVIRGLIHYYGPCMTERHYLNYTIYLLSYSCYHTLAQKFKLSVKKLLIKYNNPIRVTETINNKSKYCELIYKTKNVNDEFDKTEHRAKIVKKEIFQKTEDIKHTTKNETIKDPFSFKFINWRVGTILRAENCCICGVNNTISNIQMHHVKHIAKDKTIGFSQIMRQIKRKQIPVCKNCHTSIHDGTYDGIKLSSFVFPHYLDMEKQ